MTEHEFNTIFHKYRMHVFNFVNTILNDRDSAEDITSMVFIKLWETQPDILTDLKTKAWLFITAKSKAIDHLRVAKVRHLHEYKYGSEAITVLTQEDVDWCEIHALVMARIKEKVKSYTAQERVIFDLHFIQSLKPGDIAKILKSKPQTVSNQLVSIRKKIMAQIKTGQ